MSEEESQHVETGPGGPQVTLQGPLQKCQKEGASAAECAPLMSHYTKQNLKPEDRPLTPLTRNHETRNPTP